MIPCKETKCLKLAVCISKKEIACRDLRKYYIGLYGDDIDRWCKLNDTLPHLKRMGTVVMNDAWYPPVENPSFDHKMVRRYHNTKYLSKRLKAIKPINGNTYEYEVE